jgi:hypothetical protein
LRKIGLGDRWETEYVEGGGEWKRVVRVMMQKYEEAMWRERMCSGGPGGRGKVKLSVYIRVKKNLCAEWFLRMDRSLVRRWVRLRAGVEELEVELGRRKKVRREERLCQCCSSGEVEEVGHFVGGCSSWAGMRQGLWDGLSGLNERWMRRVRVVRGWGRMERVDWILGGGEGTHEARGIVLRCVIGMLCERDKVRGVGRGKKVNKGGKEKGKVKGRKRKGMLVAVGGVRRGRAGRKKKQKF